MPKKKPTLAQRRGIYCVLHGHSNIVSYCFGYITCARCGEQIGDTLGGSFNLKNHVIVGHDCKECRKNLKKLKAKDKVLVPSDILKEVGAK